MDPMRFTTIAHAGHVYCNPIGAGKMNRLIALLALPAGANVLDVGCGKGELLVRMAEVYRACGLGLDLNEAFLAEARQRVEHRAHGVRIELRNADAATLDAHGFDLAACIGSTHALGGYRQSLQALTRAVKPGGMVLAGQGYWRQAPAPGYLLALEATADELDDHAGNVEAGIDCGLVPLYATASSPDEWDHYEGHYALNVERFVADHPEDPDAEAMTARIRKWREAYLRWGRDTLGFGVYLFRRPRDWSPPN
jgi:SAM-dependent methyltransferase